MMQVMEQEKGYNGWKNYETWVTALWIDNDQGSYHESRQIVRRAKEDNPETPTVAVADALKAWVEEVFIPDLDASLASDLLDAAVSEVDWFEIAENYLSKEEGR